MLAGLYWLIGWIVRHWLDCIVSTGLYRIGWIVSYRIGCIVSGNTGFYALAGYWLDGTDGTDGLGGTLVRRGWDVTKLPGS